MIPNTAVRLVSSSPVAASAEFGISLKDSAHIMTILRDTLYSDKVLAVLREYGANAWDAHRDSGKADLPIKVTLPTSMEPTLIIRDYGTGLSPDEVFNIYTQYGSSTKRGSDNAVGMLGIGSKSGFAYSDSFTVTSYHGGKKSTYIAVLDDSEKGVINLLCDEPCGDETGIAIQMAVRPEDIREFTQKAQELFQYFIPRPTINTTLPKLPAAQATLKHGVIYERPESYYDDRSWVAVMGCVSYKINLEHVRDSDATRAGGVASFLSNISGALYFNIGEVQVSASREELKYSTETKLALVKKFNDLVDEYVRQSLDTILNGGFSSWEKRVRFQVLAKLNLPVPDDCAELLEGSISVKEKVPKSFVIMQNRTPVSSIRIDSHTRFILWDDRRNRSGFQDLKSNDYLINPVTKDDKGRPIKLDWPAIEADLETLCKAADIVGIPTLKLSSFTWAMPTRIGGRKINPKHRTQVFSYNPGGGYCKPWSDCWEPEERVPDPSDVFVLISNFQTIGFNMGQYYKEDALLAEELGAVLPTIYGYKTTDKKPIEEKDCIGTPYSTWRESFVASLIAPGLQVKLDHWHWSNVFAEGRYNWNYPRVDKDTAKKLVKTLGPTHAITTFAEKYYDGGAYCQSHPALSSALSQLSRRLPDKVSSDSEAKKALNAIYAKYPLLKSHEETSVCDLWGKNAAHWAQYIKLIDAI